MTLTLGDGSWQEGSAVESPQGDIVNFLRINGQNSKVCNIAAYTKLDVGTGVLSFIQWIEGPFSSSKFSVRRDYSEDQPVYVPLLFVLEYCRKYNVMKFGFSLQLFYVSKVLCSEHQYYPGNTFHRSNSAQ